jgi:hypothetical protein
MKEKLKQSFLSTIKTKFNEDKIPLMYFRIIISAFLVIFVFQGLIVTVIRAVYYEFAAKKYYRIQ